MRRYAVQIACVMLLALSACSSGGEPDVTAYLRGSTFFILRVPNPGQPSEDILLRDEAVTKVRGAVRSLVGDTKYYSRVFMSESEWNDIMFLYQDWCKQRPRYPTDQRYYTIGIRCGMQIYTILVPRDDLPAPLEHLIAITPYVRRDYDDATPTPR